MTTIAGYIVREVLTRDDNQPRSWADSSNAIAVAHELAMFYDHLLAWEERTGEQFLALLKKGHQHGMAKAFSLVSFEVRQAAYTTLFMEKLQSQRIKRISLGQAEKLVISDEVHLTLILPGDGDDSKRPSRKRKVASKS
jgi:hypothetical protein